MFLNKRVVVVLPAYNAEKTLAATVQEIPPGVVDQIILVDDHSSDATMALAEKLNIKAVRHPQNRGYGANQKTCYKLALESGADIVVMLHPDYQYSPRLLIALTAMVASGHYQIAIGSRILGGQAIRGGMPRYKYLFNRLLTLIQNFATGAKLSEYHTGYRAFTRQVLLELPLLENSDDFIFDNQILAQALRWGFSIGEISCPAKYFAEASSINFSRSCRYGAGVLITSLLFLTARLGGPEHRIFRKSGRRILE